MSEARLIDRRSVLQAAALGASSLALAACGTPPGTVAPPMPTPTVGTSLPPPTASPSPTATPTPTRAALRQRIARLLVVGFRGLTVAENDPIARAIAEDGLGGVILFDRDEVLGVRNVKSPDQVAALVASLRALAPGRELIVAIDQEGGKVTRLSPKHGFPAVASEAAIGGRGDTAVQAWAEGIAGTLAGVGVNLNFAPVVDLNVNPANPAIGALDRAFSSDPAVVSRDAEIETTAHRDRGIRTALKHFPGLGSATANTDFGVADVTRTWRDRELDPYRDLLGLGLGLVDVIMAAHVVNGQIDASAPASLSHRTVTGLLRGQLGWDGVVVTDDMGAAAIRQAFGLREAIGLALNAGNDLLLFANQHAYDAGLATNVLDIVEGLVGDGTVAESRIDEAVARVTRLFDTPGADPG
ncbi:MAG TPA: glycoside hydrolase family 3 N-terminal domain-containing protein [Candidatus Dormibacteraeota bacterium]|nr:glycoside hydrolase family 3 N-terminal domain-containing protein [Candidatus Dormibacteraeota bacterium]